MPFLEVLTRTYKRPKMLKRNIDSILTQTDKDFTHTLLNDDVGRGIAWSYQNLASYAPFLVGDYVWILDDDDLAVSQTLIADLKTIAQAHNPDVIMPVQQQPAQSVLRSVNSARPNQVQLYRSQMVFLLFN